MLWCLGSLASRRRDAGRTDLRGPALAAGYLVGHLGSIGLPPLPATSTTEWLFYVALLAGLLSWRRYGPSLEFALHISMAALLLAATLRPMLRHHWTGLEGAVWSVGLLLALLAVLRGTGLLETGPAGAGPALSALLVIGASSATLGLSSTALLAQLGGALAASLSGIVLIEIVTGNPRPARWMPVVIVILLGLLLNGYFYAQLTGWALFWLTVAFPASWWAHVKTEPGRHPWQRLAAAGAVALLMVAPALIQAVQSFLSAPVYDY